MDLDLIRKKMEDLQPRTKKKEYEKIDYNKIYWKPKSEGKHQIRIVPSKINKEWPIQEIQLHYGYAKFPIYALTNWGEKDPIIEFVKELRKTNESKNWTLAKQLDPKMRYFAQVVVRGEEEMGVRLWEFGKSVYQQLLSIAGDEDYGNFTDVSGGFDFTISVEPGEMNGYSFLKVSTVSPKRKESPLSEDPSLVNEWLENQNNILDLQSPYKKDFDSLKLILQNFLNPEDEEDSIISETPSGFDGDVTSTPKSNYSLSSKKEAKAPVDKFDALFESDDDVDDLPF
tara:strand:- start:3960 stop:4814 length:855 start_codon:yes stop_codon:yes gene_type:complete